MRQTIYNDNVIKYDELSKEAIKAIKKADSMVFIHSHKQSPFPDSPFFIRLIMKKRISKKYEEESRIEIKVSGHITDHNGEIFSFEKTACFAHHKDYGFARSPFVYFLRFGDKIHIDFIANDSNGYMKKAGVIQDSCSVVIIRNNQKIRIPIERVVVEPNSLAKMIQHNHWNEY